MNIIVTGANRGIGKAIAEAFVRNGDNVWACCRHANEEMMAWANANTTDKKWVKIVEFDLTKEDEIAGGFKTILKEKEPIDVLVNVAGIGHMGLFVVAGLSCREIDGLR